MNGQHLAVGQIAYLPVGRSEVSVREETGSRLLLVGDEPWDERITMWWNFVGRTKDEMVGAYQDWQAGRDRFGTVAFDLTRFPSPPPPGLRA